MTKRDYNRRKEPSLIILDKKININQMRVLYNSMKYPVTYVQGPPGTGKTQTIVNVTLSSFYSGKTMLICSSNNKPVDGIVEKIKFEYRGEVVNFPYLRLGNFEDVKSATLRIRDLYNYSTNKKPNDQMLDKIKISNDDKNAKLIELLNTQERRENLKTCLESSEKLIASFTGKSSNIIDAVKERIEQLKGELKTLPEATNEEITSLFLPLKENYQLSQFLYFKSLQYIEKLKKPRLYNLIQYAKNNGTIQIPPNESIKIEIGKSNGSVAEDEFFKTVSHFCSCYTTFEAERNVKITKIIKSGLTPDLANMEFDLVLYNKVYGRKMPVIAFEVNGGEHFGVVARERSDKIKSDLCQKNHIKLVAIPNYFVKAYEDIAKVILISKNRFEGIQMSMFD